MKHSILYLIPDLVGPPGGIARYSQMVCKAVRNSEIPLWVLALEDKLEAITEVEKTFRGMCYQPNEGSHSRFLYHSVKRALSERPSLILVGHPHFATLGWFLAKSINARLITFIYGIDVWQPLPRLRQFGLRQSNRIISISRFTANRAIQTNGLNARTIRILHNCVDPQFENRSEHTVNSATNLSMLTVGRISSNEFYKGHNYVIKSMPALLKQFPTLVYNIVGDGSGRPALEALTTEIGVENSVRFHGVISDVELRHQYENATLFIMPSRNEGFGFVFAEAMVQGLPVIGGNVDATPEVIVDGETGYLVNPSSVDEIVNAVTRILSNPNHRNRLSYAARNHVQRNFSFTKFQKTLLEYLSEL